MGLLKFFTSKKTSEKLGADVKAQAYDATTASLPPLLGTYPVAGNGPTNVFEDLQRSHHKMSETNLSLAVGSEASAPAPPIPRFRDTSVERPSSAPNGAGMNSSPSSRGRRDSSKGPPLSFRKPRVGSITSTVSGLSPAPRRGSQSPAVPFEGEPFRPPSAPFTHSRHFSMQSNSSNLRGFIDILDAQSEIKPSGFQSRVKAAGVRDYGEDVADRNIGENGVNLNSDKVQAFYATNNGSPQDRHDGAVYVSRAQFGDKEQPFKPPRRHDSLEMEARTKSLTSASLGQIPFRTTMFSPDRSQRHETIIEDAPEPVRGRRRQSLGSYIPTTPSSGPLGTQSTAEASVSPSARRHKRRSTTSGEAPLNELGIYTRPASRAATESPLSPKTSQKPVYLGKHNYSLPVQQRPKTSGHMQAETFQAVRPPSRGGSVANSTLSSPTQKSPSKRHSLSAIGASSRQHEWARCATKLDGADSTRGWAGRVEVESFVDSADVSSPAPSPHVMRNGPSWREDDYCRPRTPGASMLDEICEHVPVRTSSLRHWSISSATPTLSSCSSFLRPQSRHTTTTSVDMATMSSLMNDSRSSLYSGNGDQSSFCTALSALPSPLDSATPGGGFNIDDYLSSDDDIDADSFITTRHRSSGLGATNEEELLFSEGCFGDGGLQLPGLFDSISSAPDPTLTSPSRLTMRSSQNGPARFQRRLSLDPRIEAPIFSLDEEDDEDDCYDIPVRADLALGRRGTRRISALGTMYQSIEEEREEKVDVRAAVRLRKEDKARQRAMARFSRVRRRRAGDEGARVEAE